MNFDAGRSTRPARSRTTSGTSTATARTRPTRAPPPRSPTPTRGALGPGRPAHHRRPGDERHDHPDDRRHRSPGRAPHGEPALAPERVARDARRVDLQRSRRPGRALRVGPRRKRHVRDRRRHERDDPAAVRHLRPAHRRRPRDRRQRRHGRRDAEHRRAEPGTHGGLRPAGNARDRRGEHRARRGPQRRPRRHDHESRVGLGQQRYLRHRLEWLADDHPRLPGVRDLHRGPARHRQQRGLRDDDPRRRRHAGAGRRPRRDPAGHAPGRAT